jgi:hypothetical protein
MAFFETALMEVPKIQAESRVPSILAALTYGTTRNEVISHEAEMDHAHGLWARLGCCGDELRNSS